MNFIGRQMQKGYANRQFFDNNNDTDFIEVPSKWLQSSNIPKV